MTSLIRYPCPHHQPTAICCHLGRAGVLLAVAYYYRLGYALVAANLVLVALEGAVLDLEPDPCPHS